MLEKVIKALKSNKKDYPMNYTIPELLNYNHFGKSLKNNEALVNPYDFYIYLIKDLFLSKKDKTINYNQSLSNIKGVKRRTNWYEKGVYYSLMARVSTAWDNDRNEKLDDKNLYNLNEMGSFIKSLALLPYLKSIGVNTLYFLPLSKYSTYRSKGDLGSAYAVLSFTELDQNLKESLTGDLMTVEEEFKAFIEAAHILDMRVIIDIIPRTNALDSNLILDHPDWFYWIDYKDLKDYNPPYIDTIKDSTVPPLPEYMERVYLHPNTKKHLKMFKENPKALNPKKWAEVKKLVEGGLNILDATKKVYNMTIAPAFSDHINDQQPPWYDVTFFRLYLDHPIKAKKYLEKDQAPYILFDTIKSNLHPGSKPNLELWELISNIVPFYQKEYGIDGVRIDMGHALPKELIKMIISKARENDRDFCFIAEELNLANDEVSKEIGYDLIIGNGFFMETRILEGKLHEFIETLATLSLPAFACGETHDTPRLAGRENGHNLCNMLTILNYFMPNGLPFINSGQEFYEVQPMNLGIDATERDLHHLPKDDPFYGKLALFDKYELHYHNSHKLIDYLKKVSKIRETYLSKMKPENYQMFNVLGPYIGLSFGYQFKENGKNKLLLIVANTNTSYDEYLEVILDGLDVERKMDVLFEFERTSNEMTINSFSVANNPYFLVKPGEVKILLIG